MKLTPEKLNEMITVACKIMMEVYGDCPIDVIWVITKDVNRAGYASYRNWEIGISEKVFQFHSEEMLVNTLIHELLHLMNPAEHHGGTWKKDAEKFNKTAYAKKYGDITRCYSFTEEQMLDRKYQVKCPKCGRIVGRVRMCSIIKNPERWTCGKCNHKGFERIK